MIRIHFLLRPQEKVAAGEENEAGTKTGSLQRGVLTEISYTQLILFDW